MMKEKTVVDRPIGFDYLLSFLTYFEEMKYFAMLS